MVISAVSKSQFKARALEYLRRVEATGEELVITDRGRAVVRVVPYVGRADNPRDKLRGSVLAYEDPTEPIALDEWETLG